MIASLCITAMHPASATSHYPCNGNSVLESDIQRACLDYLEARGLFVWRQNAAAIPTKNGGFRRFNGMRGQSDIIGVLPDGRFLAVEIKRPGKKPTENQLKFLDRIADKGGVGMWVTSVDELEQDLNDVLGQSNAAGGSASIVE